MEERSLARRMGRAILGIGFALLVGVIGYWLAPEKSPDRTLLNDWLAFSVYASQGVEREAPVQDLQQAATFIRERLRRAVTVPAIDGVILEGVGVLSLDEEVAVPVLMYRLPDSTSIRVLVYNYAILDRMEEWMVSDSLYQVLEEEGKFYSTQIGAYTVLVWRWRDDIYVAISLLPAEELTRRIHRLREG